MPDPLFLIEAGALRDSTLVRQFQRVKAAIEELDLQRLALQVAIDDAVATLADHESRIAALEP